MMNFAFKMTDFVLKMMNFSVPEEDKMQMQRRMFDRKQLKLMREEAKSTAAHSHSLLENTVAQDIAKGHAQAETFGIAQSLLSMATGLNEAENNLSVNKSLYLFRYVLNAVYFVYTCRRLIDL